MGKQLQTSLLLLPQACSTGRSLENILWVIEGTINNHDTEV